jgi:hypothetical protein
MWVFIVAVIPYHIEFECTYEDMYAFTFTLIFSVICFFGCSTAGTYVHTGILILHQWTCT